VLTNQPTDFNHLKPILEQIKATTGRQAKEFSADAGYCSEQNLAELNRRHINAYIATGRQLHGQAHATARRPPRIAPGGDVAQASSGRLEKPLPVA